MTSTTLLKERLVSREDKQEELGIKHDLFIRKVAKTMVSGGTDRAARGTPFCGS